MIQAQSVAGLMIDHQRGLATLVEKAAGLATARGAKTAHRAKPNHRHLVNKARHP